MDFLLQSLRPWNSSNFRRGKVEECFGLPVGRSESVSSSAGIDPGDGLAIDQPFYVQRFPSVEQILRFPSMECLRRFSSMDSERRVPSIDEITGISVYNRKPVSAPEVDSPIKSEGRDEDMEVRRPWEDEVTDSLNSVPEDFVLPAADYSLILGDLRGIARYHVQKIANLKGVKLASGMTNSNLIKLADSLGLYPLIYRIHLEATGRIPVPELHRTYLDFKQESKLRAKRMRVHRNISLASQTRLTEEGRVTIDYFEGISLRLGRERDTIFRPFLHKIFREYKDEIKRKLAAVGLQCSEMRKWRDTQLCEALWIANEFAGGLWQTAVDIHLSKTIKKF